MDYYQSVKVTNELRNNERIVLNMVKKMRWSLENKLHIGWNYGKVYNMVFYDFIVGSLSRDQSLSLLRIAFYAQ